MRSGVENVVRHDGLGASNQDTTSQRSPPPEERLMVGVIGAGTIGKGVAYRFAKFGHPVILIDADTAMLNAAPASLRHAWLHDRLSFASTAESDVLTRVSYSDRLDDLDRAGLIVENVTECRQVKASLYNALTAYLGEQTIIAVNSSTIPVANLAAVLPWPGQVIGTHFMNPVYVRDAVELVVAPQTSPHVVSSTRELLQGCGFRPIEVHDRPGYVINRVLMIAINEAIRCLAEGVAEAAAIDALFESGLGHQLGPLATADLIGLDTVKLSLDELLAEYGDNKYTATPLLAELVEKGRLGRKTGSGIFSYEGP